MSEKNLGIIGGGQLGSLLSVAAKKLNIKTTIFSNEVAPNSQQNFYSNAQILLQTKSDCLQTA